MSGWCNTMWIRRKFLRAPFFVIVDICFASFCLESIDEVRMMSTYFSFFPFSPRITRASTLPARSIPFFFHHHHHARSLYPHSLSLARSPSCLSSDEHSPFKRKQCRHTRVNNGRENNLDGWRQTGVFLSFFSCSFCLSWKRRKEKNGGKRTISI